MNVSLHIGMIASCTKCSCCPKYRIKLNPKTEKSNVQFESQTAKNKKLWETSKRSWSRLGGGVSLLQAGGQPRPSWGGTPSLPWRATPSHLYKEGQGSPPRHTSFLSSKLNPRSRPRFRAIRFRAF